MLAAALWVGQWLGGRVAPDDVLSGLARLDPDAPPVVAVDSGTPAPLVGLLSTLRGRGADGAWLLLPRPGRIQGWPPALAGPHEPAVLVTAAGAPVGILRLGRSGWRMDPATGASVTELAAAAATPRGTARAFASLLHESAERLGSLGLDRPARRPLAGDWTQAMEHVPPGVDPTAAGLLRRIALILDAVGVALSDEGAAVTAAEARARAGELRALATAVEDVLVGLVGGLNMIRAGQPAPTRPTGADSCAPDPRPAQ